jgi:hypothetical protein
MPLTDALLSADSLVAGLAVAPLLHSRSQRLAAAVLFGCADGAASLAGASLAVALPAAAPAVVALYGAYLVAVSALAGRGLRAVCDRTLARCAGSGRVRALGVLGALAVALSVDNLVSSAAAQGASIVAMGCTSAALTLVGLTVGGRVLRGLPDRRRTGWVGAGVIATAVMAVLS